MDYNTEDLLKSPSFKLMCDKFFGLARNENDINVLKEILYNGCFNGVQFYSKIVNKQNSVLEADRRVGMANLYITNPESFYTIMGNKVDLFHGVNANALFSILKYGINSLAESERQGITVTTGEKWSRSLKKREFISFTDSFDAAQNYAGIKSINGTEELSFEMIIGISKEDIKEKYTSEIISDVPEVGITSSIPVENIKVILVPKEKVEFVKRVVGNTNIQVCSLQDKKDKFYYMHNYGATRIFDDKYENLKNNNTIHNPFSVNQVEKLSLGRKILKVKKAIDYLLKHNIGEDVKDYDGRKIR